MAMGYYRMLIYSARAPTGGSLRWSRGTCVVSNEDQGAMKVEGQARLEPPRDPGYAHWACARALPVAECTWSEERGIQRVTGMDTETGLAFASPHAWCFVTCCCIAPIGGTLAFCLLLCRCIALPCPYTPGGPTGQRPSPLLMLKLCSCHCPQSLAGRYPRSSGSPSCFGPPQTALGPTGSSKA